MVVDNYCNGHERNSRFHIIGRCCGCCCGARVCSPPQSISTRHYMNRVYFGVACSSLFILFFRHSLFLLRRWTLVRDVVLPLDALLLMFRREGFYHAYFQVTHGTQILFLVGHKIRFRPTVGPTGITRDRRWCIIRRIPTHHGILLFNPLLDFPRTYTKPCWRVTWSPAAMVSGGEPSFGINFARPAIIRICSSAV